LNTVHTILRLTAKLVVEVAVQLYLQTLPFGSFFGNYRSHGMSNYLSSGHATKYFLPRKIYAGVALWMIPFVPCVGRKSNPPPMPSGILLLPKLSGPSAPLEFTKVMSWKAIS
jgi:hypothetical protein